jgi:cell division protein FtsL
MCVFGVVVLQVLVSQTSFHMDRLTKQDAVLQESHGRLELHVAQLSAPERIAAEARRLGLIVPQDVQKITVGGGAGGGAASTGQSSGGRP